MCQPVEAAGSCVERPVPCFDLQMLSTLTVLEIKVSIFLMRRIISHGPRRCCQPDSAQQRACERHVKYDRVWLVEVVRLLQCWSVSPMSSQVGESNAPQLLQDHQLRSGGVWAVKSGASSDSTGITVRNALISRPPPPPTPRRDRCNWSLPVSIRSTNAIDVLCITHEAATCENEAACVSQPHVCSSSQLPERLLGSGKRRITPTIGAQRTKLYSVLSKARQG